MNEAEPRTILQAYQPGLDDPADPAVAEALRVVAADPALAKWWEEEQAFDRAVAARLATVPAPFGLKTRILAQGESGSVPRRGWRWAFGAAVAVAAVLMLAQVTGVWHRSRQQNLPQEFALEMTSFIQLAPPLQFESSNLGVIKEWVATKATKPVKLPAAVAALEPIGCRVLSFRGQDVTLICFHAGDKRLAHLFVVDRTALPGLAPGAKPIFANEHGWMTATWAEADHVYMITMQGSRAEVEQFLPKA